jgi:putative Ca2+/H+ antiporter (TMEM165/GDT1 family)
MDFKTFASTFAVVFLAELGDKTQLTTFAFASSGRSKIAVLLGAASALVTTSVLAVVAGAAMGKYVNPVWLKRAAGVLMLGLGVYLLVQKAS